MVPASHSWLLLLRSADVSTSPWALYDALIEAIPGSLRVRNAACGRWSAITHDAGGCGISLAYDGDHPRPVDAPMASDAVGMKLRDVASWARSWHFPTASLGVAAINSWFNSPDILASSNSWDVVPEPIFFADAQRSYLAGRKTTCVGHFKGIEAYTGEDFHVLERNPRGTDFPDPAAEYLIPECDVVLVTGSALVNKTMPRLLELSRHAETWILGPSTTLAPKIFGVSGFGGAVVVDADTCVEAIADGTRGSALPDDVLRRVTARSIS